MLPLAGIIHGRTEFMPFSWGMPSVELGPFLFIRGSALPSVGQNLNWGIGANFGKTKAEFTGLCRGA